MGGDLETAPRLTPQDWQKRYLQQAAWTESLRDYLFRTTGLAEASCVLEVGCGAGAILADLHKKSRAETFGVDIDLQITRLAMRSVPEAHLAAADAYQLPFPSGAFDFSLTHFLFLWLKHPLQALAEMRRVTRPGGWVLALAEPDHAARIDYPPPLDTLGALQRQALERQGADPAAGRRLGELFHQASLTAIQTGLLGGQWSGPPAPEAWQMEWQVLRSDLAGLASADQIDRLEQEDRQAWQAGSRVLFVPTFYAIGQVP